MSIFDRFRRQDKVVLPEDVDDYYENENDEYEHKRRAGIAWLIGLGTLIVTILISLALFYGGRYIWRQFATNNDKDTGQVSPDGGKQTTSSEDSADFDQPAPGETNERNNRPRTGDRLPANGDTLPATGDPGM